MVLDHPCQHVEFERSPVKALLDTGSLVTIGSMRFLLQALAIRNQGSILRSVQQRSSLESASLILITTTGETNLTL